MTKLRVGQQAMEYNHLLSASPCCKGHIWMLMGTDNPASSSLPAINGVGFGDGTADNERHGLSITRYFANAVGPLSASTTAGEHYNHLRGFGTMERNNCTEVVAISLMRVRTPINLPHSYIPDHQTQQVLRQVAIRKLPGVKPA